MKNRHCYLKAAYGRRYAGPLEVAQDWFTNRDFILLDPLSRWNEKPVNRSQIIEQYTDVEYDGLELSREPIVIIMNGTERLTDPGPKQGPLEDGDPCPTCGEPMDSYMNLVACGQGCNGPYDILNMC